VEHLEISISGSIQKNNFDSWKKGLLEQIELTNLDLETDNDYAVAFENVKSLKNAEKILNECKVKALDQTFEIQSLFNAIDEISETARQTRLVLERQVKIKKQLIKSDLILQAQQTIVDYCGSKAEAFSYLNHAAFSKNSDFELAIKGKSSLTGVEKALNDKVLQLKLQIDVQEKLAKENHQFISNQTSNHSVLFQDLEHLISLPHSELKLTVENRIVKLSEQEALQSAKESESEFQAISNEALHGVQNSIIGNYIVTIDVTSTHADAISVARDIKQFLIEHPQVTDIKLSKQNS
jgi:hypothetical protein